MKKLFNFLFFYFRYPLKHKINFIKLYLNYLVSSKKQYKVPTEFVTLNHNLHKFKDHCKNLDLQIKGQETSITIPFADKSVSALIRYGSSDIYIFDLIFVEQEYKAMLSLLNDKITTPQTIVDCGANIGCATLYLNAHYPNAKYICIEPDPQNAQQLEKNLNKNKLLDYKVYQKGLWNTNTLLYINSDFRDGLNWSYTVSRNVSDKKIETIRMQEIIKENNLDQIDLLKIDIEGAEKEVFLNDSENCNWLDITKILVIEIHDEFNCRNEIVEILKSHNFQIKEYGELSIAVNLNLVF